MNLLSFVLGTRVQREAAQVAPIAHTADDSPYNPNDAAVVAAYWKAATIHPRKGQASRGRQTPNPEHACRCRRFGRF